MLPMLEATPEGSSEAVAEVAQNRRVWMSPSAWLAENKLERGFWIFFWAEFLFDFGFAVYFFLFNLYPLDMEIAPRRRR